MEDVVISAFREAVCIICYASLPALITALVVGLGVSLFQAVTQIQEQTLSYIPKILCVFLVLMMSAGWMMQLVLRFAEKIFSEFESLIGLSVW
ncbi:MAG: flagellar biosynthesis protein FliQ [bacterium]